MAALLLKERGYDVSAVMMTVKDDSGYGCGATEDLDAAKDLAERIGVPLTIVDCAAPYRELVLDYFRQEYLGGRTPNPCVRCNPLIKFGILPALAREMGQRFDYFATGHYARIEYSERYDRLVLMRGVDLRKDQSYFLYRLSSEQLAATLFPLGGFTKQEVRAMAAERGLAVHDKPDSQDFYAGDYAELLGKDAVLGDIVDEKGRVVGKHDGYWNFTPGQRKGLGIAHTEPLYVIRVEPEENRVVVGTKAEQLCSGCLINDVHFSLPLPEQGTALLGRMRSSQPLQKMTAGEMNKKDGTLEIRFAQPQHGIAPGQSLVLYEADLVIGGGIIAERL